MMQIKKKAISCIPTKLSDRSFSLLYVSKGCMYCVHRVISSISCPHMHIMWFAFIYHKIKGVFIFPIADPMCAKLGTCPTLQHWLTKVRLFGKGKMEPSTKSQYNTLKYIITFSILICSNKSIKSEEVTIYEWTRKRRKKSWDSQI